MECSDDQTQQIQQPFTTSSSTGNVETNKEESGANDNECTICMESIAEEVVLPCKCKLHYCQSCWVHALAESFQQCGQPRCPSCRALVRVDFDAEKQYMVFTPETVDMTYESQNEVTVRIRQDYQQSIEASQTPASYESLEQFLEAHEGYHILNSIEQLRQGFVEKLRHQAMPYQIKLVQQYFEANPSVGNIQSDAAETLATVSVAELKSLIEIANIDSHDCLEKSEMISRVVEQTDTASLCCLWASQKCAAPKCVCGSSLLRITGLERFKNFLGDRAVTLPDEEIQREIQKRQRQGVVNVICDICENSIPLGNGCFVWTCENRSSTILHATSYDICDKCFVDSASRGCVKAHDGESAQESINPASQ